MTSILTGLFFARLITSTGDAYEILSTIFPRSNNYSTEQPLVGEEMPLEKEVLDKNTDNWFIEGRYHLRSSVCP